MKDFETQVEKLEKDAAECDLIAQLATDERKRKIFNGLADNYRAMAAKMRTAMASFRSMITADQPPDR